MSNEDLQTFLMNQLDNFRKQYVEIPGRVADLESKLKTLENENYALRNQHKVMTRDLKQVRIQATRYRRKYESLANAVVDCQTDYIRKTDIKNQAMSIIGKDVHNVQLVLNIETSNQVVNRTIVQRPIMVAKDEQKRLNDNPDAIAIHCTSVKESDLPKKSRNTGAFVLNNDTLHKSGVDKEVRESFRTMRQFSQEYVNAKSELQIVYKNWKYKDDNGLKITNRLQNQLVKRTNDRNRTLLRFKEAVDNVEKHGYNWEIPPVHTYFKLPEKSPSMEKFLFGQAESK